MIPSVPPLLRVPVTTMTSVPASPDMHHNPSPSSLHPHTGGQPGGGRPYRTGRLSRQKSFSSTVLPTISIMVDDDTVIPSYFADPVMRRGRRDSISAQHLNHAYTSNSLSDSHYSYHSHPNLNFDLLTGTMYLRPNKKDGHLNPDMADQRSPYDRQSTTNHTRSSFLSLFTKRRQQTGRRKDEVDSKVIDTQAESRE